MDDRTRNLMFSSANDEYETPPELFQRLHEAFDFTIDLAAAKHNALLDRYYSIENDALKQSWGAEIGFCNPPYSMIGKFLEKAANEFHNTWFRGVFLIPARTETKYMHNCVFGVASAVCFIKGRLKFANPTKESGDKPSSAPFPSMLVLYDEPSSRNLEVLNQFGYVMVEGAW